MEENENIIDNLINNLLQDTRIEGGSSRWANWKSMLTLFSCKYCVEHHGKIVDISILNNKTEVNAHFKCQCIYVPMRTKTVGTATDMWRSGVDSQLFYSHQLPDYYISKAQAIKSGWRDWRGNLNDVLPGKMLGGDIYKNREGKLPSAPGRVWYEADMNYKSGYRNRDRILYSNDGLIFVTYDHYQTFYEITE